MQFFFDRETAEPAILIKNLNVQHKDDIEAIVKLFSELNPQHYMLKSNSELYICFRDMKDAEAAVQASHRHKSSISSIGRQVDGRPISVEAAGLQDHGEFKFII